MRALFIPDNLQAVAVKRLKSLTLPGVPAEHLSLTARLCGIEKGVGRGWGLGLGGGKLGARNDSYRTHPSCYNNI